MRGMLRALSAGLAAALLLGAGPAARAEWPDKAIRMIVPFAAGGGTDFIARIVANKLSERLGQQVFVENRGGANGGIGLAAIAQADPDGYTIGAASDSTLVVNPWLYAKLPYKPTDFALAATVVRFPGLLAVHPSVPAKRVAELIALAKAKPGTLAYASGGIGNFSHLAAELFAQGAGIKLLHVPYKGVGPGAQALIGGDVQLMFNNVQTMLPNVQAGQLVALAVNGAKRMPALPDLPTVAETVPGFEMAPWVGIIAPAQTPKPVMERLSREVLAVMHDPVVVKVLTDQHVLPYPLDPAAFGELMTKDLEKWGGVIKQAGIKVE